MDFSIAYGAIVTLLLVAFGGVTLLFKNKKTKEIFSIVKRLVDAAEEKYGSGTGEIKYDYVVSHIYGLIPGYLKMFISETLLDFWIETAVDELQEVLDKKIKQ